MIPKTNSKTRGKSCWNCSCNVEVTTGWPEKVNVASFKEVPRNWLVATCLSDWSVWVVVLAFGSCFNVMVRYVVLTLASVKLTRDCWKSPLASCVGVRYSDFAASEFCRPPR